MGEKQKQAPLARIIQGQGSGKTKSRIPNPGVKGQKCWNISSRYGPNKLLSVGNPKGRIFTWALKKKRDVEGLYFIYYIVFKFESIR